MKEKRKGLSPTWKISSKKKDKEKQEMSEEFSVRLSTSAKQSEQGVERKRRDEAKSEK